MEPQIDAIQAAFERTVAGMEAENPAPTAPIVETPILEAPIVAPIAEVTPTEVVETGAQVKKIEAAPEAPTVYDWKAEYEKATGRKFEEDEKVLKAPKEEFTELAKRLNIAEKAGKTKEFLKSQSTDWDSESEERIVKAAMKKEYGLGDEDINQLFASKYKTDEENNTEQEIAIAKILLKADAAKQRQILKSEQVAAFEGFKPQEQTAEQKENERLSIIERERVKAEVFDYHSKLNELEVALPDKGVAVTFPITQEQKKEMIPYLENPNHVFSKFYTKEGKWDSQKWVKFVANVVTQETAIPAMLSKYGNSVLDEDVKQRKNFTLDKTGNPVPAEVAKAEDELKKYFAVV